MNTLVTSAKIAKKGKKKKPMAPKMEMEEQPKKMPAHMGPKREQKRKMARKH